MIKTKQELLNHFSDINVMYNNPFEYQTLSNMIDELLGQEPKTGHWIIRDEKEQGYDIAGIKTWYIQIVCSECGWIKTAIEGHTGQYHYCPNCGARMESEENECK